MRRRLRELIGGVRRIASPKGRGFTMVELLITIALVAILVAVTLPAMTRTMQRIDSRSSARTLANVFRQARDQAVSRGEVVLVQVDTATNDGELTMFRTNDQSLRCNGIDVNNNVTAVGDPTNLDQLSSDLVVGGIAPRDSGGIPNWLCFSPEGTVLDPDGDVIHHQDCPGENFRMWIVEDGANLGNAASTTGVSQSDLTGCPTAGSTWSETQRNDVRNARYLARLWLIDVPYNGNIRAYQ